MMKKMLFGFTAFALVCLIGLGGLKPVMAAESDFKSFDVKASANLEITKCPEKVTPKISDKELIKPTSPIKPTKEILQPTQLCKKCLIHCFNGFDEEVIKQQLKCFNCTFFTTIKIKCGCASHIKFLNEAHKGIRTLPYNFCPCSVNPKIFLI